MARARARPSPHSLRGLPVFGIGFALGGRGADVDTMSQIFHRHTNVYSRLSILAVLVFAGFLGWVVWTLHWSGYSTNQAVFVSQPIQFSHAHHVGGMGIDCRYCHTTVEESAFANIPPTKTCMNCHSQIWADAPILEPVRASFRENKPLQWTRVHDLPDFVYFNHSIHVKQGRGMRDVSRARRQNAADVSGVEPDDVLVPRLPPESGALYQAERPGLQHGLAAAVRRSATRRAARARVQDWNRSAADELLDLSQVVRRSAGPTIHMDFSAVRSRLAGADGRFYWRSLGELADTNEFREYLHREFPEQASEWNDPKGRRQFLKLMSASLALAGVGACTKQPPGSHRSIRPSARGHRPGKAAVFRECDPARRLRSASFGRKSYGASDQD